MTQPPDFEALLGDVAGGDRARLRRVHHLLVEAGPPPELSPELEAGPNLMLTRHRPERTLTRRPLLLVAAAAAIAAVAFLGGRATRSTTDFAASRVVPMRATAAAPLASARIEIGDRSGDNWAMRLVGTNLPALTGRDYYEVFLMRGDKLVGPCGSFVVHGRGHVEAYLNAPYKLRNAWWIVTRQHPGDRKPGPVVFKSATV
jgi:hypothetical protein